MFIIYIEEAHATDVWNIGESAGELVESHKNIVDRIGCVKNLKNKYKITIPIYADNMNNEFEKEYSSWPFRYYIINHNHFVKIGDPVDSEFNVSEMIEFIDSSIPFTI
ncbi:iodothyronine deiodinase [Catovirus CTV1]|uniref:Iodothyronine deiodinase n=1 Tax=Catovirus CTV1 TaxID=1977631 RepID=A0A1V0SBP1_9VIRU|nr:iodothyronine deiodinase [Catovirus CTV1]